MAIYFRFKSAKDYCRLPIDGMFASLGEIKQSIAQSKLLGGTDYDLLLTNAQTGEDYEDERMNIPRNSYLVCRRVAGLPCPRIVFPRVDKSNNALGCRVEPTFVYDSTCYNSSEVTSSLTDVLQPPQQQVSSTYQGSPSIGKVNVDIKSSEKETESKVAATTCYSIYAKCGIPSELLCPICNILMNDAVLLRCCFQSFCCKCIRDHIISKGMCFCHATIARVDELVPNNTVRKIISQISECSSRSSSEKSEVIQKSPCLEKFEASFTKAQSEPKPHPVQAKKSLPKHSSKPGQPPHEYSSSLEDIPHPIKNEGAKILPVKRGMKTYPGTCRSNSSIVLWDAQSLAGGSLGAPSPSIYGPCSLDVPQVGPYPRCPNYGPSAYMMTTNIQKQSGSLKRRRSDEQVSVAATCSSEEDERVRWLSSLAPLLTVNMLLCSFDLCVKCLSHASFLLCFRLIAVLVTLSFCSVR